MSCLADALAPRLGGQGPLPAAILERPEVRLDRTLRAFLSALAWFARGDKHQCYPSVGRLAAEVGCSPGHLRRQIRKAVSLGLVALIPAAWNRCRRVFALLWKPNKGVDARGQPYLFSKPGALPERPGTAPYPSAQAQILTCAPVDAKSALEGASHNAGGGGEGSGEPPPPPAEEGIPEAAPDLANWRAFVPGAVATPELAPRPVAPPAAPVSPLASCRKAGPTPEDLARIEAELATHKARRLAQAAPAAAAPPSSSEAAPAPAGGLWSWLKKKSRPPGEGLGANPDNRPETPR